jgi:hypothetical protein
MIVGTAVWLWKIFMIVVAVLAVRNPHASTVTVFYYDAASQWHARVNMYDFTDTMNYLPQFAILYTGFLHLPLAAAEIIWRLVSLAVLVTGLWRVVRRVFAGNPTPWFLLATILSLPLSAAAVRNGQANVILSGLMLHAAVSLMGDKWWTAALLLTLALVAKPIVIAMVLLAVVIYRPLRFPMAVLIEALFAFPFLFAGSGYVMWQYQAFFNNLFRCSIAPAYDFADISGILWPLHIQLPHAVSMGVRAAAALVTLALVWFGTRRLREPLRAFWLLTFSAGYLMLFNPLNESNTYVILAPAPAVWAGFFMRQPGRRWMGGIAALMVLSMGILPNIVRPWFGNKFALCYHPAMTFLFLAILIAWLLYEKPTAVNPAVDENSRTFGLPFRRDL